MSIVDRRVKININNLKKKLVYAHPKKKKKRKTPRVLNTILILLWKFIDLRIWFNRDVQGNLGNKEPIQRLCIVFNLVVTFVTINKNLT